MSDLKAAILKHLQNVPRYTSYPSAPHFVPQFDPVVYAEWLNSIGDTPVSLYVHIPFCAKLCWFCGCNTRVINTPGPVDEYLSILEKEVALVARQLSSKPVAAHLHFGGGSPTILPPPAFARLMGVLQESFSFTPNTEAAIEIDPRQLTEGRAAVYAKAGINRISIGVQDFNADTMAAVNRPQPFHCVYQAVQSSRAYGIDNINIDLMYGLPHQTVKSMRETFKKALTLQPNRISFFGYAHVPWMKKHMRLIPEDTLPQASQRYDLFQTGVQCLKDAGYVQIGIDHFARPDDALCRARASGRLHRNFQGYVSDECTTLIGLGASSIGHFEQGYVQNIPSVPQYRDRVEAGILPVDKFYVLTPDDRLIADIIERLMCDLRVDLPAVCLKHKAGRKDFSAALARMKPLCDDQLVRIHDDGVVDILDPLIARVACSAFDAHLQAAAQAKRHSSAV